MTLLKKLIPDSRIFQQDPEKWSKEELKDATARITAVVAKHRAARGLTMENLAKEKEAVKKRAPKGTKTKTSKPKPGGVGEPVTPPEGEGLLDSTPPWDSVLAGE